MLFLVSDMFKNTLRSKSDAINPQRLFIFLYSDTAKKTKLLGI